MNTTRIIIGTCSLFVLSACGSIDLRGKLASLGKSGSTSPSASAPPSSSSSRGSSAARATSARSGSGTYQLTPAELKQAHAVRKAYSHGLAKYNHASLQRQCDVYAGHRAFIDGLLQRQPPRTMHRNAWFTVRRAKEALERFERELKPYGDAAPARFAQHLAKANELADGYARSGTLFENKRSVFDSISPLRQHLSKAGFMLTVQMVTLGKDSPKYAANKAALAAAAQRAQQARGEAEAVAAAKRRPPRESYRGRDARRLRTGVRQHWERKYPGDRVLRVFLVEDRWHRKSGWDRRGRRLERYDSSWLKVKVAVKTKQSPGVAEVWAGHVKKEHHNRNQIRYDVLRGNGRGDGKILVKNVR